MSVLMEDQMKIFLEGIKTIYPLKGFTQKTLAARVGSKQSTLSSYFRLRTRIKPAMMRKIIDVLGVPYEEIFETGRKELQSELTLDFLKRVEVLEEKATAPQAPANIRNIRDKKYGDVLYEFSNPELAKELCRLTLELEKLEQSSLAGLKDYIKYQIATRKKQKLSAIAPGKQPSKRV